MPFSFSPLAMGTSVYLYMASLPVVNAAKRTGQLGKMVLLPFVCMGLNCFLWATYGFAVSNVKVLAPAIFGLVLSIYYLGVFYALTEDKDLFWSYIQIMLLFVGATGWYMYYIVSNMHAPYNLGMIASFINVLMYGAPAAELPSIWRTGNTESMPFGLSMATFMCSVFWWLYGLELEDPFLIWPNVLGIAFGIVQLFTIFRFSGRNAQMVDDNDDCTDQDVIDQTDKDELLDISVCEGDAPTETVELVEMGGKMVEIGNLKGAVRAVSPGARSRPGYSPVHVSPAPTWAVAGPETPVEIPKINIAEDQARKST